MTAGFSIAARSVGGQLRSGFGQRGTENVEESKRPGCTTWQEANLKRPTPHDIMRLDWREARVY
jgi:hypothetical protein